MEDSIIDDLLVGNLVNLTPIRRIVLVVHRHDINNSLIRPEIQIGCGG